MAETISPLLAQCINIGGSRVCGPFPEPTPCSGAGCPTNAFATPGDVVTRIMEYAFPFAGIILIFIVIASGYQLIVSSGEASKIQAAVKRLTFGFLGFVLLILTYLIVKTVAHILGFDSPV